MKTKSYISLPVATVDFLRLVDFLRANGDPRDPVDVAVSAIDYWIENASWKPDLLAPFDDEPDARGYQWKNLFLPHGTQIRMQYKGAYHYAKVEGDELIYEGEITTPGTLANKIAGTSRNAWRDLWVKKPGDTTWKLADDCRRSTLTPLEDLDL